MAIKLARDRTKTQSFHVCSHVTVSVHIKRIHIIHCLFSAQFTQ